MNGKLIAAALSFLLKERLAQAAERNGSVPPVEALVSNQDGLKLIAELDRVAGSPAPDPLLDHMVL
jgi:hypothetical protein